MTVEELIREEIQNDTFVKRGCQYFKKGSTILEPSWELHKNIAYIFNFRTMGRLLYNQKIVYDIKGKSFSTLYCSCSAYKETATCKHLASSLFELEIQLSFFSFMVSNCVPRNKKEFQRVQTIMKNGTNNQRSKKDLNVNRPLDYFLFFDD